MMIQKQNFTENDTIFQHPTFHILRNLNPENIQEVIHFIKS